jgi:hypothetical protein
MTEGNAFPKERGGLRAMQPATSLRRLRLVSDAKKRISLLRNELRNDILRYFLIFYHIASRKS